MLLAHPGLFRRYIVLSPSLWFDDGLMLRRAGEGVPDQDSAVIYMAAGELEGRIDDEVVAFSNGIESHDPTRLRLRAEVFDDETHRTIFGRGFTDGPDSSIVSADTSGSRSRLPSHRRRL